ncbi:caspase family protein [Streptomyces cinnabarinus]|uniref:Caspase family protein n=1 Tax=Streptomyces cinnabarinus TaxID=67287 RepID=A0ABY7KD37_9ACTN|nr:caspase family protein [Streptomyces cinnabarinus]WAZ22254.1 caspase family protein [Streptomyces cinnabarinus]
MSELSGITPERTRAILVGVESYADGPFHDLDGSAQDALGHARWLRENGVPAEHIRLCVSPLDSRREQTAATARALGIPLLGADHETVRRIIRDELPEWDADLLWLTWSGHGAITSGTSRHLLIHADARPYEEAALDTANLQNALLYNPRYQRIRHKVVSIDACRNHVETLDTFGESRIGTGPPTPTAGRLLLLHATQDGDISYGDERGGAFTRALLAELDAAEEAWPPDPRPLIAQVRGRMAADADVPQIPSIDARTWDAEPLHYAGYRSRTRPSWLLTTDEVLRRLGNRGTYLTNDALPYVAPEDPAHPARPENLLVRLDDPGRGRLGAPGCGLLLTGLAGAGKTRTCLEIAALAERSGWQVLHIHDAGALSARVLFEEIQEELKDRQDQRLLLVLDYLDQHIRDRSSLDLRDLADLLHAERAGGARIACLASVRPGALAEVRERGSRTLFEEVELEQAEAHLRTVAARIFEEVAPNAFGLWGADDMARICGTRPILALLLAIAFERTLDQQDGDRPAVPPPSELVDWLNRRTRRDIASAGGATRGEPDPVLVRASTLATLACVQRRAAVEDAVDRFLERQPGTHHTGESIVDNLEALGWLVTTTDGPDTVDTIHDIVTDQLLEQSCLPQALTVDTPVLRAFLDALLGDVTTFRRAVGHLSRWAHDQSEAVRKRLAATLSTWLTRQAADVLALLLSKPDQGMRTLVSMSSATPWQQAVIDTWDDLAGPWIARTTQPGLVRVLLTDAIRNSPRPVPPVLLDQARAWLDEHTATDLDALQLISALRRTEDPDAPADERREHLDALTRTWLEAHGGAREARYALLALLTSQRDGAPAPGPAVIERATRTTIALAHQLRGQPDTERLITALMRTARTDEDDSNLLHTAARDWLALYRGRERATFLISATLRRRDPDVRPGLAEHLGRYALDWLVVHGRREKACFVLHDVLSRRGQSVTMERRAVEHALKWLARNGHTPQASFVLQPLLQVLRRQRASADPDQLTQAVDRALTWTDLHPTVPGADFVIRNLLEWQGLATRQHDESTIIRRTLEPAIDWLDSFGVDAADDRLLKAVFFRTHALTGEQTARVTAIALNRLPAVPEESDRHIIGGLLRAAGPLPVATKNAALTRATAWLTAHGTGLEASLVLGPYLLLAQPADIPAATRKTGAGLALDWLGTHSRTPQAFAVLRKMLFYWDVPTDTLDAGQVMHTTIDHILDWLEDPEAHSPRPAAPEGTGDPGDSGDDEPAVRTPDDTEAEDAADPAGYRRQVLVRVLFRFGARLTTAQAQRAADIALRLYRDRSREEIGEDSALHYLHRLPPLPGQTEQRLLRQVRRVLTPGLTNPGDARLLQAAVRRLRGAEEPDPRIVVRAVKWLDRHHRIPEAGFVLCHLLQFENLPKDAEQPTLTHAWNWLRKYADTENAAYVLAPLLLRREQAGAPDDGIVGQALGWLAEHGTSEPAWRVISRLADYTPAADHRDTLHGHALAWAAANPGTADPERLIAAFTTESAEPAETTSCTSPEPAPAPR